MGNRGKQKGQSGQVLVIVAGAMVAILAMVALILMGGTAYWERRHLQELADSAVLAAAIKAGGTCNQAQALVVANEARGVLAAQLGNNTSGPVLTQGCGPGGAIVSYGFADGTTADINWPWKGNMNDYVMATLRHQISLQLPAFVGQNANIGAVAIATTNGNTTHGSYALYAYHGITCNGGGLTTIKGSVYSGGPIDKECSLYVQEVTQVQPDNTIKITDPGDVDVFPSGQQWFQGGGDCTKVVNGKPSNAICADGYEVSGGACAITYPGPNWSMYYKNQQDACPGSVLGPAWQMTKDPNHGASALKQLGGTPCPVLGITATAYPAYTPTGAKDAVMRASSAVVKPTPDSNKVWHFHPGCYAWIDVANVPGGTVLLEPGFYFFNGFYAAGDPSGINAGGIALNGSNSRLLGYDVTLEFANPPGGASSFSGTEINPWNKTTSSCGGGQSCYLGADPKNPVDGHSYFAAPCTTADAFLEKGCPTPSSQWCIQSGSLYGFDNNGLAKSDPSCYGVLVWAPPPPPGTNPEPAPIGGSFWFKGTASYEWAFGEIEWPNNCAWSANGDSILIGNMICYTANVQGGSPSSGPGVKFGGTGKNPFKPEPGLKA